MQPILGIPSYKIRSTPSFISWACAVDLSKRDWKSTPAHPRGCGAVWTLICMLDNLPLRSGDPN